MAGEQLSVTYYPSCVVNLKIRFDDAYTTQTSGIAQQQSVDSIANNPPTDSPTLTGGLTSLTGTATDGLSHIIGRIPKSCSVELPAYRQAGKFRLTFDFRDLPIDPRMIRSVGVEIYMDSVPADDFAGAVPQVNPPGGQRDSMLTKQGRLSMLKGTPDNLVLMGVVDSWHVSHSGKGSEATIEGRDLVGLFLNTPITAEMLSTITIDQPIDKVIRELVTNMQGWASGLQVLAAQDNDWPDRRVPVIGKSITDQVTTPRVRQVARQDSKGIRLSAGADPDKMNFWDVVTRWCYYVGAVPVIRLMPDYVKANIDLNDYQGQTDPPLVVTLYIRPVNTIYSQLEAMDSIASKFRTPFNGGAQRVVGAEKFSVRRMMFGRNISELNLERKYTGTNKPKLVRVVSYNSSSNVRGADRLIQADWPPEVAQAAIQDNEQLAAQKRAAAIAKNPKAARRTTEAPSGEIAMQDILRISIPGITDQKKLEYLAKQIYEEIARGEMGGSCQTKSLASFGAGNEDPDLVRLRPGDGIQLRVDARELQARAPSVSPMNDMAQKSDAALIQEMTARLGDARLATAIVQTLRDSNPLLANIYRVSNVKFDWNISSGIAIAFDFQNYVEIRNSIDNGVLPSGSGSGAVGGQIQNVVPPPME